MAFVKDASRSGLLKNDYLKIIQQRIPKGTSLNDFAGTAEGELLYAILTCFIRQERFCDGLWAKAIEEKVF